MANTLNLGTDGNWAVKKDSLLAYNSENNNYKPLPFDFTRASSATVVNKDGLIETVGSGEPRIDFSNDAKGALLLEPSRSNVLPYSEDFSQWGLDGGTQFVTPNYAVSPDGTQNAYRLQLDKTGGSYSRMYLDAGTIGEKTSSIWIKSNNNSTQNVGLRYDGVGVNLEITSVWKRFELTATSINVSRFQVILLDSIAGNDESCDIQIYGAQLEEGSYPTSYIPTSGSAVTRVAESTSQTVPDGVIGQTEGVMLLDVGKYESIGSISSAIIFISNALGDKLGFAVSNTKLIRVRVNAVNEEIGGTQVENSKTAIRYTSIGIDVFYNGVKQTLTTIGSEVFSLPTSVSVVVPNQTYGIKGLQLYNTALTDQELIALTTI